MADSNADPLEDLLNLEEKFYKEGYDLGVADGARAGYTEGSIFAVEKGYEKLLEMGKLYGRALVWTQRLNHSSLPATATADGADKTASTENSTGTTAVDGDGTIVDPVLLSQSMPRLPSSARLAKHIQTLLELVDPATLCLDNTEEAVNDVEERLKGAMLKARLIQRALGEATTDETSASGVSHSQQGDGSGSIEDVSSLYVRH
ncbi:hypothetical protein VTN31DRAFT_4018 [Thermomyces dupontii]|uniref:uncharacterized protein n=1 Tax=Talaromyces thermophilus TaxID=28565 RepID=UPI0037422A7B